MGALIKNNRTKTVSMKKGHISILLFGVLMALLTFLLHFFEYKYQIGSLDTDVYTAIVATLFTVIGVWIGINLLKPKPILKEESETKSKTVEQPNAEIDTKQIDALELNKREYEILLLIAKGHTNQEIADLLFLAVPTIKTHITNLYSKLEVKNRTQAIIKAQALKILP